MSYIDEVHWIHNRIADSIGSRQDHDDGVDLKRDLMERQWPETLINQVFQIPVIVEPAILELLATAFVSGFEVGLGYAHKNGVPIHIQRVIEIGEI